MDLPNLSYYLSLAIAILIFPDINREGSDARQKSPSANIDWSCARERCSVGCEMSSR